MIHAAIDAPVRPNTAPGLIVGRGRARGLSLLLLHIAQRRARPFRGLEAQGGARRSQKEPRGARKRRPPRSSLFPPTLSGPPYSSVLLRTSPSLPVSLSDCAVEGTSARTIPVTWSRADNTPGTYGMYTSTLRSCLISRTGFPRRVPIAPARHSPIARRAGPPVY
jgi:hypothetical protein